MNERNELKRNALYYEQYRQRLVFIDEVDDDVVVASDYHSSDRLEYEREELEAKFEAGEFFLVDDAEDRDDHEDDSLDSIEELKRYEELCKQLGGVDGVVAKLERGKTYAPCLYVRAKRGYGAPSNVFSIIVDEFDADEVLSVEPTETESGDVAITYRAKYGGY